MLRQAAQAVLGKVGLELHRKTAADLPYIQTLRCAGEQFDFWIANQHTKEWWGHDEVASTAEIDSLKALCAPGSTVLDIGAHHGFLSVLFARWAGPSGGVHCFEANASNALVLGANIALNRLTNCVATHAAVGASSGVVRLSGECVAGKGAGGREVRQIAIDNYCQESGLVRVDLLKIDVEGSEGNVLCGCAGVLETRPKIALELHLDDLAGFQETATTVLDRIPLQDYEGEVMIRPDWQTLRPWRGPSSLPARGVVNLFLRPRK